MPHPPKDPAHWLYRFTTEEWLRAADHELALCEDALRRRAVRAGVTLARRAAGMAWNAVLVTGASATHERYGRSYMEHVVALSDEGELPDDVRAAARVLRETPATPPALVTIGKPSLAPLESARRLVAYARTRAATVTTN